MNRTQQEVKISPFQNAVIKKSYDIYSANGSWVSITLSDLAEIATEVGLDESEIRSQMRELSLLDLAHTGDVFSYNLTWKSLDAFERNYPDGRVYENNKVRRVLLDIAYDHRNNQAGGYVMEEQVYADDRAKPYSKETLLANAWYLIEAHYVEGAIRTGMGFRICLADLSLGTNTQKRATLFPISPDDRISLDTVCNVIQTWTPRQTRHYEEAYKAELREYLLSHGYPKIGEELGVTKVDILVEDVLPIEIKKNPTQDELDRMSGQIRRMRREYGQVIALIVQSKPGGLDALEQFKREWEEDDDKVRVVIKSI